MAEQANFKRINFFEGFFTTDEDWNASEAYHLEKRRLHKGVREIRDALDPRVPGSGEVDLRFVPVAGYAGSHATPQLRVEVANGLSEKASLTAILCKMGVAPANYLRNAVLAVEMLNNSNSVGPLNLADVLLGMLELEREMVEA